MEYKRVYILDENLENELTKLKKKGLKFVSILQSLWLVEGNNPRICDIKWGHEILLSV